MRHLASLGMVAAVLAGCSSAAPDPISAPDAAIELDVEEPGVTATDDEPRGDEPTVGTPTDAEIVDDRGTVVGSDATPEQHEAVIGDYYFEADAGSVQAGETVTWTHEGDITHNVTARDDSFASDNLAAGETFRHTFESAGSFEYRCTLHGQMVATVDVV